MYIKSYNKKTFLSIHYKKIIKLKHDLKHLKKNDKNIGMKHIKIKILNNLRRIINFIDTKYSDKYIHISSKKLVYNDLYNTNHINSSLIKTKSK